LDRLTRSLFDFADLVRWLDKNGKILISVSEGIDMSKPAGRMIANVLVAFAQFELERMGERRREAAVKLRAVGRMGSGRPAYGYMRKEGDDRIRQNPDNAPIVRRIVNEVIDGLPMSDIAERLTADGVQSTYGSIW